MSAIFILKKEPPKKHKFFIFLKGRYFVVGGPIDMNVEVFWETYVGFLKTVVLQLFPKYSQSYVNLNVKSRAKFNCLNCFYLNVTYRTLEELFRMALVKFVTFVVLKILGNLVSMQNFLNATNSWRKQNFANRLT